MDSSENSSIPTDSHALSRRKLFELTGGLVAAGALAACGFSSPGKSLDKAGEELESYPLGTELILQEPTRLLYCWNGTSLNQGSGCRRTPQLEAGTKLIVIKPPNYIKDAQEGVYVRVVGDGSPRQRLGGMLSQRTASINLSD